MRIHWSLFKNATFKELASDDGSPGNISLLEKFCNPVTNPANAVIQDLLKVWNRPLAGFEHMKFRFGIFDSWPAERKNTTRRTVLILIGQLIRKLVEPWEKYPWKLWPLAGKSQPEQVRAAGIDLLKAHACCLDTAFSGKLKAQAPSLQTLLSRERLAFLQAVFDRVVVTSTFIERRFAHFSRWTQDKAKRTSLAQVAAKHIISLQKECLQKWKDVRKVKNTKNNKSRPAWVRDRHSTKHKGKQSAKLNGCHVFTREFKRQKLRDGYVEEGPRSGIELLKDANAAWSALSREEKQKYSVQARGENALQEAAESQTDIAALGGPWEMAEVHGQWPLSACHIENSLASGFKAACGKWRSEHSMPEPLESELPPTSASVNLFHPCPAGCCLHSLSAQEQQTYAWLRAGLCALVRQRYPKARDIAANPVVLEWQTRNCRRFFVVAFSTLAWSMVSRCNLVLRFVRLTFEERQLICFWALWSVCRAS